MAHLIGATRQRRGLAPLEVVLCLPVLLFVLALMVDSGSKACWKLRGVVAARDAAWRTRWDRTAGGLGNPPSWPPPAVMTGRAGPANAALDAPPLDQPVVRGPALGSLLVDRTRLDPSRGGWTGESGRAWTPPLLAKLGTEPMDQKHPLFAGKWQHAQMGIPVTNARRIPYLYTLPQTDPALKAAFLAAVAAMEQAPFRPDLDVLDRDEEIFAFYGRYEDFHPRVAFCDFSRPRVATNQRASLVRRIQGGLTTQKPRNGIPGGLVRFWISMYSQQLKAMEAAGNTPANSPAAAALKGLIDALQTYLNALP